MHHRPPGKSLGDQDRRGQLPVRQALRNPYKNSQPAPKTNADVAAVSTPWLGTFRYRHRWYRSRRSQPAVERLPGGEVGILAQSYQVSSILAGLLRGRNLCRVAMTHPLSVTPDEEAGTRQNLRHPKLWADRRDSFFPAPKDRYPHELVCRVASCHN